MGGDASELDPRVARTIATVLAAGEDLLAERGVQGITIEEVARRTGIAKTTIYRHWPSKAELIIGVLARQAFEFPTPDSGDAVEDLRVCLSALSRALSEPRRRIAFLGTLELAARDATVDSAHRQALIDTRSAVLADVCTRALAARRPGVAPGPDQLLPMLVGPIVLRALIFGERVDDDTLAAIIDRVLGPAG